MRKHATYTSIKDLNAKIRAHIDGWTDRAHPFTWTKTADQILAKANRKKTSNAEHYESSVTETLGAVRVGVVGRQDDAPFRLQGFLDDLLKMSRSISLRSYESLFRQEDELLIREVFTH